MVNKIISGLMILIVICCGAIIYFKIFKKDEPKIKIEETKKGTVKRKITKPTGDVIEETEVYESKSKSVPVVKNYLLGLTLGYDFDLKKQTYSLIFGRYMFIDIYLIGKIETTRIEGGLIWTF